MPVSSERKFSGSRAVRAAAAYVLDHRADAMRAITFWLAVIFVVLQLIAQLIRWFIEVQVKRGDIVAIRENVDLARAVSGLMFAVVFVAAYAAIIVPWYRMVLRGGSQSALRMPSRQGLLYVFFLALMYLGMLTPILVAEGIQALAPWMRLPLSYASLALLVGEFLTIPAFLVSTRFVLKLPAIAVDDASMTLRRSWFETTSMWPGLAWGTVVIYLPLIVILWILRTMLKGLNGVILVFASSASYGFIFLAILIYATFLSLAYREVVGAIDDVAIAFE